MTESLRALNLCLLRKGVTAMPLRYQDGKALIYLCRIEMLDVDLRDPLAEAILREYGYPEGSPIRKISWLIRRGHYLRRKAHRAFLRFHGGLPAEYPACADPG